MIWKYIRRLGREDENTINSLLFLSKSDLSYEEQRELNDKEKFIVYFKANESENTVGNYNFLGLVYRGL